MSYCCLGIKCQRPLSGFHVVSARSDLRMFRSAGGNVRIYHDLKNRNRGIIYIDFFALSMWGMFGDTSSCANVLLPEAPSVELHALICLGEFILLLAWPMVARVLLLH